MMLQGFHAVPNQSAEYDGGIDIHMEVCLGPNHSVQDTDGSDVSLEVEGSRYRIKE